MPKGESGGQRGGRGGGYGGGGQQQGGYGGNACISDEMVLKLEINSLCIPEGFNPNISHQIFLTT